MCASKLTSVKTTGLEPKSFSYRATCRSESIQAVPGLAHVGALVKPGKQGQRGDRETNVGQCTHGNLFGAATNVEELRDAGRLTRFGPGDFIS